MLTFTESGFQNDCSRRMIALCQVRDFLRGCKRMQLLCFSGVITRGSQTPFSKTELFQVKYSLNSITWHSYKETGKKRAKVINAVVIKAVVRLNAGFNFLCV